MPIGKKILYGVCLFLTFVNIAQTVGHRFLDIYQLHPVNKSEVGISCRNGADPTGRKEGEIVIISCEEVHQ